MSVPFALTVQEMLDSASPSDLPEALGAANIGEIIAGLIPRWVSKTGLTSSASQIHMDSSSPAKYQPFVVHAVTDGSDAPLAIIGSGSVGAGEVKVEYSTDGVPTLTFNAAVTAYKVLGQPLPKVLGQILANKPNWKPPAYP